MAKPPLAHASMNDKENRLFDRYDNGEIERAMYERQLERVRADKADRFEKLRDGDATEDAKRLVTAERVWNSRGTRDRSGKAGAKKGRAVCSRRWFVTHGSKAEPCVMTYKSPSPRWPRCAAKGDGVPTRTNLELHASSWPRRRKPVLQCQYEKLRYHRDACSCET